MEYTITHTLDQDDFFRSIGRYPNNEEEFDRWGALAERGLKQGHIDWDIIFQCTSDNF